LEAISYHLEALPGEEKIISIYKVPGGTWFRAKKIEIFFPTGVSDELHIVMYHGAMRVFPEKGDIVGDAIKYEKEIDELFKEHEDILIWYKNDNPTYSRIADIVVEGVFE